MKKATIHTILILLSVISGSASASEVVLVDPLEIMAVDGGLLILGIIEESSCHKYFGDLAETAAHPISESLEHPAMKFGESNKDIVITVLNIRILEVIGGEYDSTYISVIYPYGKLGGTIEDNEKYHPIVFQEGDTLVASLSYGLEGRQQWLFDGFGGYLYKNGILLNLGNKREVKYMDPMKHLRAYGKTRTFKSLCMNSDIIVVTNLIGMTSEYLTVKILHTIKGGLREDTIVINTRKYFIHQRPCEELLIFLNQDNQGYAISGGRNGIYCIHGESLYRNGRIPMVTRLSDVSENCYEK